MASTTVRRTKTIDLELPDKPGELARLTAALREANVDMCGTWGWGTGSGTSKVALIGKDHQKLEEVIRKTGKRYTTGECCICEGDDRAGALNELLQKIGKAGVNIHAVDAIGTGGKFCTVIWADKGQQEKLCQALGC